MTARVGSSKFNVHLNLINRLPKLVLYARI
jgi:hypothetical protein